MDRNLEALYKTIQQAMDGEKPKDEAEAKALIDKLIKEYNSNLKSGNSRKKTAEEASDEFLEMAQNATSLATANKYVDKAIELNPDNFDACSFKIVLRTDLFSKLNDLDSLLEKEEEKLRKQGCFKNIGNFWMMFETRPYMRGLDIKRSLLESLCRISEAIQVSETMIKLCKNDNLGVRYHLIGYYALQENLKKATQLHSKYDNEDSIGFYLPLAVCYFRLGQYEECKSILLKADKSNKNTIRMLKQKTVLDRMPDDFYSPGDESEALMAVDCCRELLFSTLPFFDFLKSCFPGTKPTKAR